MLLASRRRCAGVPAGIDDVGAPLFSHRPQPHVRLGEDPHHLEPVGERPRLELIMLEGERIFAPGPADHRLRLLARARPDRGRADADSSLFAIRSCRFRVFPETVRAAMHVGRASFRRRTFSALRPGRGAARA